MDQHESKALDLTRVLMEIEALAGEGVCNTRNPQWYLAQIRARAQTGLIHYGAVAPVATDHTPPARNPVWFPPDTSPTEASKEGGHG